MNYQCNHSGQTNLLLQITSQFFSVHIENEVKVALGAIIQIHLGPLNHMFPMFFYHMLLCILIHSNSKGQPDGCVLLSSGFSSRTKERIGGTIKFW